MCNQIKKIYFLINIYNKIQIQVIILNIPNNNKYKKIKEENKRKKKTLNKENIPENSVHNLSNFFVYPEI